MQEMTAYVGDRRETEVPVVVADAGCGAGWVTCFECGGDGDWTKFYPEPETLAELLKCVECKGTGRVLIGV